jgi:carbonic anhydrase
MASAWLRQIERANQPFRQDPHFPRVRTNDPQGRLVLTCMDNRINMHAVGIAAPLADGSSGDRVPIIRTAGARLDAASLFVAILATDVKEILVLGHTQCQVERLHTALPVLLEDWVDKHSPTEVSTLRADYGATSNELKEWVRTFADVKESVIEEVKAVKDLPFTGAMVVHGAVYDIEDGSVEVVVDGTKNR